MLLLTMSKEWSRNFKITIPEGTDREALKKLINDKIDKLSEVQLKASRRDVHVQINGKGGG